jgi:microcystin-dependent protein
MAMGELMLFAGDFTPVGFMPADGRTLIIQQWEVLHTAVGEEQGSGSGSFTLPALSTTWPAGAFSGGNGRWLVNTFGYHPSGGFGSAGVLPLQVVFTAVRPYWTAYYADLTARGATDTGFGGLLGARASAYALPYDLLYDSTDTAGGYVGELRLFGDAQTLPGGWLPADGSWLDIADRQALWWVLSMAEDPWGSTATQFRLPDITAPDGYRWAISTVGFFPTPR